MNFNIDRGFGLGEDAANADNPDVAWRAFARALGSADTQLLTAAQAAELVNKASLPPASLYDQLGLLAGSATGQQAVEQQRRLSELVRLLQPLTLSNAISAAQSLSDRKRLLQTLVRLLSIPAVMALLRAAAHSYKQPLSPVMVTLVTKSARRAQPARPGTLQDTAFRDLAQNLLDAWTAAIVDTTSTGYDSFFASEESAESPAIAAVTPEAERMLALAFETGAMGATLWHAVNRLGRSEGGIRQVINMLKTAPPDSNAADTVAQQLATPDRLRQLLHEKPLDLDAVDVLLSRMLEKAGDTLLDALIDAPTPGVRRQLLQRMSALGPSIWGLALERLKTETRPHALRDLLASLRRTYCDVRSIPLERFIRHEDVRVRREALLLLLDDPVERERAVVAALRDPDPGMLKIGLKAAREGLPEAAVPILRKRVIDPKFPVEFRTSALQLLARSQSLLALEVLLAFAAGKTLLGKTVLAAKSPEMLIALSGLARMWSNEARALELLNLARSSTDEEIVTAVNASQPRIVLPERDEPA